MSKRMKQVINAFKATFKEPIPTDGEILCYDKLNKFVVSSVWTQSNVERKTNVHFERNDFVDWDGKNVFGTAPVDNTSVLLSKYSPNGKLRALFRDIPEHGKTPKKQHLEVWDKEKLIKVIDPTLHDLHADVYTDGHFGCLSWSPCSTKILYIAEMKRPKTEPFLPRLEKKSKENEETTYGNEYEAIDDWGETLQGKASPVIAVCDVEKEEISLINGPPNISFGKALWAPDDGVISVGWDASPRRMGIVYCTNRPSWIFHLTLSGTFEKLSGDGVSVRSPVLSPDGTKLVWLERGIGGPHHGCMKLMKLDWGTKKISTVVDVVPDCVSTTNGEQFYGIFGDSLGSCWADEGENIIVSSPQRASIRLYEINVDNGEITDLTSCSSDTEEFSETVLDVRNNWILCTRSSFLKTPSLVVGRREKGKPIEWLNIVESRGTTDNFLVDVLRLEAEHDSDTVKSFSTIYVGPNSNSQLKNVPIILMLHGGPHSFAPNKFSKFVSFMTYLGYAVCVPNYRGSIGHGHASVEFLPGKVGSVDVHDCHQSLLEVLDKHGNILDKNECYLFGGSHGGFLVLHLAGQFPTHFKSVVSLNPVVDLTGFSMSDIPDWAMVEAGYQYAPLLDIDGRMFDEMKKKSPIHFVDNVDCPILMLIGKNDLRVPPHQGINYYHRLKARGVKTKMLTYNDNHGLTQNSHEVDWAINTALWFLDNSETQQ